MHPQHARALQYIRNTGGHPTIAQFDDDHEPIGPLLRQQMHERHLIHESGGRIADANVSPVKIAPGSSEFTHDERAWMNEGMHEWLNSQE